MMRKVLLHHSASPLGSTHVNITCTGYPVIVGSSCYCSLTCIHVLLASLFMCSLTRMTFFVIS